MQLIRDQEFEALLPPPSAATQKELETQLVESGGPRDPIRVWKGRAIIVDGYRRHAICEQRRLPYRVEELEFPDRSAVKAWMLRFQLGRRNLNSHQEALVLASLSALYKGTAKRSTTGAVADRVAQEAGVTPRTVHRATAYASALERLPADIREKVASFQPSKEDVVALAKLSEPEIRGIWRDYASGEYGSLAAAMNGEDADEEDGADEISAQPQSPPPTESDRLSRKDGEQKCDPRLFAKLESELGGCLRSFDRIHRESPSDDLHGRAIAAVKLAMRLLGEWRRQ